MEDFSPQLKRTASKLRCPRLQHQIGESFQKIKKNENSIKALSKKKEFKAALTGSSSR
jgi:hypothetical protein